MRAARGELARRRAVPVLPLCVPSPTRRVETDVVGGLPQRVGRLGCGPARVAVDVADWRPVGAATQQGRHGGAGGLADEVSKCLEGGLRGRVACRPVRLSMCCLAFEREMSRGPAVRTFCRAPRRSTPVSPRPWTGRRILPRTDRPVVGVDTGEEMIGGVHAVAGKREWFLVRDGEPASPRTCRSSCPLIRDARLMRVGGADDRVGVSGLGLSPRWCGRHRAGDPRVPGRRPAAVPGADRAGRGGRGR